MMDDQRRRKYSLHRLIAAVVGCNEWEIVHLGELAGGGAQAMLADGRKMRFSARQLADAAYHLDLQEQARAQAGSPQGQGKRS